MRERELSNRLKLLEEKLDNSPSVDIMEEYSTVKQELGYIFSERARGAMMRSRCDLLDKNEKCTKFFLKQEHINYNIKHIKSLMDNGKIITNPESILELGRKFYENLYVDGSSMSDLNIDLYLKDIKGPKLKNDTKLMFETALQKEEIKKAIKEMPNNKTPGPDGIPIEFYKIFWNEVKEPLMDSFRLSKKNKILPLDQRLGIITMIPKSGKDIRDIKNWRPITLLNCDYKILTKTLSNRMKVALGEIINSDQIGYMEGRFCGENTRLIADIIEYSTVFKKPGILLLVDFEKAFDSISWNFLFSTLRYFNFGENFIEWINIIYKDIFSCIINNGNVSKNF